MNGTMEWLMECHMKATPSLDCLLNADGVELSKTNVKSEKKLDFDPCFHSNRYSD